MNNTWPLVTLYPLRNVGGHTHTGYWSESWNSFCYILGRTLLILGMSEKHCSVEVICICVDTIYICLAPVRSLGWLIRSCIGVWGWGVGGGFVEDHWHWGSVSQRMSGFPCQAVTNPADCHGGFKRLSAQCLKCCLVPAPLLPWGPCPLCCYYPGGFHGWLACHPLPSLSFLSD